MKSHDELVSFIPDDINPTEFILENHKFGLEREGTKLTESDISSFESILGIKLPNQLRSFYLHWNGGLPYPIETPQYKSVWVRLHWSEKQVAASVGTATSLSALFRINADPDIDFYRTWKDFKDRIPHDLLCFARDLGGSLFLIGIKEYNLGKIFFWDSSYEADIDAGEIPSYDNIAFVANSFVEFLLALREEPDEGESLEDWVKRVYAE